MPELYGIRVTPSEYQRLSAVLVMEEQAGWKPTKADVADLIRSGRKPSPELQRDSKEFDKLMKKYE